MSLLLTLNRFTDFSSALIVNFEQLNDYDKDINRTDIKMNVIRFFKLGVEGRGVRAEVRGPGWSGKSKTLIFFVIKCELFGVKKLKISVWKKQTRLMKIACFKILTL